MADIYYKGHTGREIQFNNGVYNLNRATDLFSYEWGYSSSQYADRIESFNLAYVKRKFEIGIMAVSDEDYDAALREINDVFDFDVRTTQHGRLYCNDRYLNCYIYKNGQGTYDRRKNVVVRPYTLIAENGQWIREKTYATIPSGQEELDRGIDYPHDYPHDYAWDSTFDKVVNDSVEEADFKLTIYGPAVLPDVTVGDNHYAMGMTIYSGDRIVIDSIKKTVTLNSNGIETNVFNSRVRGFDIFKKIPIGESALDRNGQFDVTLVVYDYRSEPEWWKD